MALVERTGRPPRAPQRSGTSKVARERLQAGSSGVSTWEQRTVRPSSTTTIPPPLAVAAADVRLTVNPRQTLFLHWSEVASKAALLEASEPTEAGHVLTEAATNALRERYRAEGRRALAGPGLYVSRGLDTSEYGPELLVVRLSDRQGAPVPQARLGSTDLRVFDLNAEHTGASEAPWAADYANGAHWSVITRPPRVEEAAPVVLSNPTAELAAQFWAEQRAKLTPGELVSLLSDAMQASKRDLSAPSRRFVDRILGEFGYDYLMQTPLDGLTGDSARKLRDLLRDYPSLLRNDPRQAEFERRFPT